MRLLFSLLLFVSSLHAIDLTFPKLADAKRIHGELVSVDFIHRSGQFRAEKGELMDFTMPPYAIMKYRGAESDLRDVPLGAKLDFLMLSGGKLITTEDGYTPDAEQQKKFRDFTEMRGVAGWIDKTDAKTVTVTLFSGAPADYEAAYGALLVKGKETKLCVANDELRTWNPGVDGERGSILEVQKLPTDRFGSSGYQITVSVSNMLEGFRRGRVVRIFLVGWKVQDQFYGESLMGYGFGRLQTENIEENPAKEYSEQFPFRTDFSNAHLAWYQLKPDATPPRYSDHLIFGELVKADTTTLSGQYRDERTGELVDFSLMAESTSKEVKAKKPARVRRLGADATLADLPLGERYRFHLYQDERGAFTRASLITDEFSHLTAQAVTYRVEHLLLESSKIRVAHQIPEVKDYNGDMKRPPDIGRSELRVVKETRVWKGDQPVKLADIQNGDALLVNLTCEQAGSPAHCADVWIQAKMGR